jgi:hypothetical protein
MLILKFYKLKVLDIFFKFSDNYLKFYFIFFKNIIKLTLKLKKKKIKIIMKKSLILNLKKIVKFNIFYNFI